MPVGASRRPTAQSFVNPKTIPRKLIKISFIFVCINYMIWNVNEGHWTPAGASRRADGAVVCKSQKNSKEIAKNIIYLYTSGLHDIQCNWGPSDACERVTTANGAVICKSQKNSKEIDKNIVYFYIPSIHDIKCNWGPLDACGRVTTGRRRHRL